MGQPGRLLGCAAPPNTRRYGLSGKSTFCEMRPSRTGFLAEDSAVRVSATHIRPESALYAPDRSARLSAALGRQ